MKECQFRELLKKNIHCLVEMPVVATVVFVIISISLKLFPSRQKYVILKKKTIANFSRNVLIIFFSFIRNKGTVEQYELSP